MRSHSIVKRFVNSMSKITERTHVKKEDEAEVNSVIKAIVKELAISIRDAGVEDTFGKEISTKAELRKATEEAAKDAVLAAFDDIDLQYADSLVKNYLDNKGGISYINRVSGLTESRRRKHVKESRFRFRRSRIAEGTEISMAKARELSVNSFTDTSEEVIWAIFKIAKDEEDAQRIWEDPSPSEQKRVIKLAFDAADEDTLYWGDQEFNRDESISESRFRASRSRLHESADKDEVVDCMIGELEGLVLSEVFFDGSPLESWTEAKGIIEDYIIGVTQDRILDSDEDFYDAFDDAVKELGGWDKVKKLVKWNEYAKEMGVKESRSHSHKSRLKEWNDYNDPPESYWGRDRDSIDSAIDSVIKIYNVDGLLGDGDNVSSAYEAALEGEEDVAITRAEIISELKWDIAHEASKFVDDEDEIDPSEVSDEEVAPLVAKIITKLKKAGVLVESRLRRGRIVESDEKRDEKEKLFKQLLEYCEESEFLAKHVIQPYLEENDYPEITVKEARDMIEEYNAFDLNDCYDDIIAAIGDTPEEIGKKVTDTLFTDSDIKEIIDLAWDNIHRHREEVERWYRLYDERKKSNGVKESRLHEERTDEYEDELHNFRNDYVYEIGLDIDEILSQGFDNTPYASDIDKFGEDGFLDKFEERWTREAREMAAQYEPPILGDDAVEEYEVCLDVALKNNGVDSLEQVFSIGIGKSKNVTESRTKTINESSMAGLIRIVNRHRF